MRVAIVNDSPTAVEAIRRSVSVDARYRIAWIADDGDRAIEKCKLDPPDVVLMDLIMPRMNGAAATGAIMRERPVPILIVTVDVRRNFSLVCEAMSYGAFDAIDTPDLAKGSIDVVAKPLLEKLGRVDRINERLRATGGGSSTQIRVASMTNDPTPDPNAPRELELVAIGSSTGGPAALATILGSKPKDSKVAVVIIQHIGTEFVGELVNWLRQRTSTEVYAAERGIYPQPGKTYVAAKNDHLILSRGKRFEYAVEPVDYPYRPSVDVFFHSLAASSAKPNGAALLTGIGRDGASGLLALRRSGWYTVAQNEQTCVVYGMPAAAVELGAAVETLPIELIGPALFGTRRRKGTNV
jgi:chemotaxis response regulator CheB